MFLLGRAILVLAGGFLLRALTEGGTIPPLAGFALGMVFSLGLIFMTYRVLGKNDRIGASSLAVTTALVAYPFLTESITKLHLVSAQSGGLALALITAAGLGVAWYRHLRFMAWVFCIASLFTMVGLGLATSAPEFFAVASPVAGCGHRTSGLYPSVAHQALARRPGHRSGFPEADHHGHHP